MAGRLGSDENGRLEIVCNAKGVLWVEDETTCAINDLGDFKPSSELRQLVPLPNSADTFSHPLVVAQLIVCKFCYLTRFKCGGACLGIGVHHTLADGTIATHFVNSWSEIARGLPQITEPPLIDRTLFRAQVPSSPIPKFHHVEYDPPLSLSTSFQPNPQVSVFRITLDQLNTLKAKSIQNETTIKFSTYNILAAYIWRCATKARGLSDNQATRLDMPTNGRPRLRPPLPSGYLGNVLFVASLTALSGNLQSEPFMKTVERIHEALKRMDDEYLRSALDYLEKLSDITTVRRGTESFQCPNLHIINWMRLPLNGADFGLGQPIYTGPANVFHEGKIYLLPSPESDESLSLIACLDASHMENFQKHLYQGLM
ncbi:Transferase [Corchorus olitorius]|uniref:Transferase n=1 Tax=Corchorus olitorius TaxID=93759 RepID=A0A1R3J7N4_9ROSI|nr:Transferase [Corchorus olitorius]